jgi:hypothetical protein
MLMVYFENSYPHCSHISSSYQNLFENLTANSALDLAVMMVLRSAVDTVPAKNLQSP